MKKIMIMLVITALGVLLFRGVALAKGPPVKPCVPHGKKTCPPLPPPPITDADADSVPDTSDNCVDVANPDQADIDGDLVGDACDSQDNRDSDNDSVQNWWDQCPGTPSGLAVDANGCSNRDGDSRLDDNDVCPDAWGRITMMAVPLMQMGMDMPLLVIIVTMFRLTPITMMRVL